MEMAEQHLYSAHQEGYQDSAGQHVCDGLEFLTIAHDCSVHPSNLPIPRWQPG